MSHLKKLTLLHSNDMHGDFMAEELDSGLVGGVSLLSGYINRVRREEENVIYAIAGDMFRGSVIDTEFRGISTIQLMNILGPDIVTLGNHEVDYGLAHLLFLEKCAEFPIINANMYLKTNHTRLFEPCRILEVGGMKVLFIGVITESALVECRKDGLIGTFVTLEDAAAEIGRICDTYNSIDVDFTVLLTHIGFEEDKKLAQMLDPAWGVDVIIGGHSHTFLTEPCEVNGIPIVQAGTGTDQIGRFDIVVDTENNCIDSYSWQPVPINAQTCTKDTALEDVLMAYHKMTDEKYARILTTFARELTHPSRYQETELGDLFADIMKDALGVDIFLMASGSIRVPKLGPVVTKGDFEACFPFEDSAFYLKLTGAQLKHAVMWMLRDEAGEEAHTEFYQFSRGLEVEYDRAGHAFLKFLFEGEPVTDEQMFTVGLQEYHYLNMKSSFDLDVDVVLQNVPTRILASCNKDVIEEKLIAGHHQDASGRGRLIVR